MAYTATWEDITNPQEDFNPGDQVVIQSDFIGPLACIYKKGDTAIYEGDGDFRMYDGEKQIISDLEGRLSVFKKIDVRKFKTGDRLKQVKAGNAPHRWVTKRKVKPKKCECCKERKPYDLANKGIYNRELKNWEWLCRRCHMSKDGRLKKLNEKHKKNNS